MFRRICILAGCDYLHGGLPGVGLKKAEIFFSKTNQSDLRVVILGYEIFSNIFVYITGFATYIVIFEHEQLENFRLIY